MYECPNCASGMRFSIERQMMFCDACGTTMSPYDVGGKSAEEHDVMQVNVFTCPQCAGEIVADTNEAMTFCVYCGASTLLESRLETMEKPARIIPFKKTKGDCIVAYKNALKKSFFVNKSAREESKVESFRGIYMPYWVYNAKVDQNVRFEAKGSSQRRGDYVYTDIYSVEGHVNADYDGFAHDASSTFPDRLSEGIAPYDLSEAVPFAPAFMSGFYGDAGDIDAGLYRNTAYEAVKDDVAKRIDSTKDLRKYTVNEKLLRAGINPNVRNSELVMLPVWFMSARYKDRSGNDRITYSVVNGQTGALASEQPVSIKAVLGASLIIAAVAFLAGLFIDFNIMPDVLAWVALAVSLFALIRSKAQDKALAKRENGTDDKGLKSVSDKEMGFKADEDIIPEVYEEEGRKKTRKALTAVYVADVILTVLVTMLWIPASDLWYFGLAMVNLSLVIFIQIRMISRLNLLATRPLPQFKRKGGDDGVK